MSQVQPSHWLERLVETNVDCMRPRPALLGDRDADVCIVGAGFTGLWTALSLLTIEPSLDVVVLEASTAGYGASGRNGGAAIGKINGSREFWARRGGRDATISLEAALRESVDEIGRVAAAEQIDCGFEKAGSLAIARRPIELARLRARVEDDRHWGVGPDETRLIGPDELAERVVVAGALGARFYASCASIDPGALVRGLARAVEHAGGTIHEETPVAAIEVGCARTRRGRVRARFVLRAVDAYADSVAGHRRELVPVHTSMLVTERLSAALWDELGWRDRETVSAEHPFLHLQRTLDGRITIGGDDNRVPYRFRSRVACDESVPSKVVARYRQELVRLFPTLRDVRVERAWQGVVGARRDWAPGVDFDRATGLGSAGGYVGEGVAASNLAGRTLADLVLGRDTPITRLPWVGYRSRRWEPEPLRIAGATAVWTMRSLGERAELRTGRPSTLSTLGNRVAGLSGVMG